MVTTIDILRKDRKVAALRGGSSKRRFKTQQESPTKSISGGRKSGHLTKNYHKHRLSTRQPKKIEDKP